jgi:hypothetical protein
MANVTGGDDQNYSRRGRASRFYEEQTDPNFFQRFMGRMQGMGQSMASAVGLEGEQAPDPRVTGVVVAAAVAALVLLAVMQVAVVAVVAHQ